MTDADTHTIQDRLNQFDKALSEAGQPNVQEGEQVARLIPKRNIETWILSLNSQAVNEQESYKQQFGEWNKWIISAVDPLTNATLSVAEPPSLYVDSLRSGIFELKKLSL